MEHYTMLFVISCEKDIMAVEQTEIEGEKKRENKNHPKMMTILTMWQTLMKIE